MGWCQKCGGTAPLRTGTQASAGCSYASGVLQVEGLGRGFLEVRHNSLWSGCWLIDAGILRCRCTRGSWILKPTTAARYGGDLSGGKESGGGEAVSHRRWMEWCELSSLWLCYRLLLAPCGQSHPGSSWQSRKGLCRALTTEQGPKKVQRGEMTPSPPAHLRFIVLHGLERCQLRCPGQQWSFMFTLQVFIIF